MVDQLAGVLAAEDARQYNGAVLSAAARFPDPIVRRHAALAMGRIGDPAALPTLLDLLTDEDSIVQQDAAFALGLIADPSALGPLRTRVLSAVTAGQTGVSDEAISAIAKIGGPEAGSIFAEVFTQTTSTLQSGGAPAVAVRAVGDAWRLGADAPVTTLVQLAESGELQVRRRALYSLSRLRPRQAGGVLLNAANHADPEIRDHAARALTSSFADSSGLGAAAAQALTRLTEDSVMGVRVNALRTLGTYDDRALAGPVIDRLSDPEPNVRVVALATLARLADSESRDVLIQHEADRLLAARQQALAGLARVDRATALVKTAAWITNADWRLRSGGAQVLGVIGGDTALGWLELLLEDSDGRVVASALSVLDGADSVTTRDLVGELLTHRDPVVRRHAAERVRRWPRPSDLDGLIAAYELALGDPIPDARVAVVEALGAIAALGPSQAFEVEDAFLGRYPTCEDYLVRGAAEEHLPMAARRWGGAHPIQTGRDIGDYRDIARRLLLPAERAVETPSLVLETDRGRIVIQLFAADAPLTVNALLELVDRQYFDNGVWHRVVPNFVIQGGDPRGDGWGGPGFSIRDEVSRRGYGRGTVGIALSGPDTGGSQFFITHTPQPHLDGTYTVIGTVQSGMDVVDRVTQGDRIRTVRRP